MVDYFESGVQECINDWETQIMPNEIMFDATEDEVYDWLNKTCTALTEGFHCGYWHQILVYRSAYK